MYAGEEMPFSDIIFMQAKKLARAIKGEEVYKGFKYR